MKRHKNAVTALLFLKNIWNCLQNGSLYQPGNKRDFINKIMDLYKDRKKCLSIAENNVETAEKYSMKHAVKKNGRNLCKHFPSDAFSGLQHERIYKVEGTWVKFPVWWKGYLNR